MKKRILLSLMVLFLIGNHNVISASWINSFNNHYNKAIGLSTFYCIFGLSCLYETYYGIFSDNGLERLKKSDPDSYYYLVTLGGKKIARPLVLTMGAFCFLAAYLLCKKNYEKIKNEKKLQKNS